MDSHYNSALNARLQLLFAARDWDAVVAYLSALSNAHFRTAGYMIGERLSVGLEADDFWSLALRLITWQAKAFTVTIAKAAALRLKAHTLSLQDGGFLRLAESLRGDGHLIDRQKLIAQLLPSLGDYRDVELLFSLLDESDARRRVDFLVHADGLATAFVLLRTLRFEEHDKPFLSHVCRELLRRAANRASGNTREDSLSYNMASLLRTFFDLTDVRGTFSLAVKPYELARIDTDFETFVRVLTKV